MPRLQPPAGFSTAANAAKRLEVSQAMLSKMVSDGQLKRYGPATRKHKFYKDAEIEAILAAREHGFEVANKERHRSVFSLASAQDMPAIVEISRAIFNTDGSEPIPVETRLAWLRKNPETFFVLRDLAGTIVGYASILPLSARTIDRFIRDEIEAEDISGEDVLLFQPGRAIHLYIMAIGIDPRYSAKAKHEYGARLVNGLFSFLLELAQRGVEIASITARSFKPDGIRIMRKMGIPQLPPLTPGKRLFVVEPSRSGLDVLMKYTELLREWKATHSAALPEIEPVSPGRARPAQKRPVATSASADTSELPDGYVSWSKFAQKHQVPRSTVQKAIDSDRLQIIRGEWKVTGAPPVKGALDQNGQAQFYRLFHNGQSWQLCSECPHGDNQAEQQNLL